MHLLLQPIKLSVGDEKQKMVGDGEVSYVRYGGCEEKSNKYIRVIREERILEEGS
jgi:hypothetical protein